MINIISKVKKKKMCIEKTSHYERQRCLLFMFLINYVNHSLNSTGHLLNGFSESYNRSKDTNY